jgi:hypothetical protein
MFYKFIEYPNKLKKILLLNLNLCKDIKNMDLNIIKDQ